MGRTALEMPPHLAEALGGGDVFEKVMTLQGEVFRDVPGRKTLRVWLEGKPYFVKQHFGVGWREIFKNLLSLRLPIIGAETEWKAIYKLHQLGIATTPAVAYGYRGFSPASMRSFLITEDLGAIISLEDFCRNWGAQPPPPRLKRRLITAVAQLACTLHDHGLNHRDFYICHLCLDAKRLESGELFLYLIDLHRVGIHAELPTSARMKDMAALYFSALDCGLSVRDKLRFLRHYRQRRLRDVLRDETGFWEAVSRRADKLYAKFQRLMQTGAA